MAESVLLTLSVLLALAGGGILGGAKSAIHESEAFLLWTCAAVLLTGALGISVIRNRLNAILAAIRENGRESVLVPAFPQTAEAPTAHPPAAAAKMIEPVPPVPVKPPGPAEGRFTLCNTCGAKLKLPADSHLRPGDHAKCPKCGAMVAV